MIPDERLSVLISGIDLENISPHDIIDMATELLSLREQKKRLIKLAKELIEKYEQADDCVLAEFAISDKEYEDSEIEIAGYKLLLKELEEKK